MKCPKCRYLSFEPEIRCKHCGFDFSMADNDMPLQTFDELEQQDPDMPLVDLQLRSVEPEIEFERPVPLAVPVPAPALRRSAGAVAFADRVPQARPAMAPVVRQVPTPTTDLPLFIKGVVVPDTAEIVDVDETDDDKQEAVMHVPVAPRPLVVRRRAPEPVVRRVETEAAPLPLSPPTRVVSPPRIPVSLSTAMPTTLPGEVDAFARLKAASLDFVVLAILNISVILLTLRQCEMSIGQIDELPWLPLGGFLASITVGYLLSFSVGNGKTIGKMVFGLRVVGDAAPDDDPEPTPRQMSYRALLTVPSILLLGLGFLPGLVGEGRAVHDRLTHTRVVRE